MADRMTFPETFEEFLANYSFEDSEEIYTNKAELIPVFRVKQGLDHYQSRSNNMALDNLVNILRRDYYHRVGTSFDNAILEVEKIVNTMKENSKPKKPIFYAHNYYCTECGNLVGNNEFEWQRFLYCDKCRQKLDWQ